MIKPIPRQPVCVHCSHEEHVIFDCESKGCSCEAHLLPGEKDISEGEWHL